MHISADIVGNGPNDAARILELVAMEIRRDPKAAGWTVSKDGGAACLVLEQPEPLPRTRPYFFTDDEK
jgi:hypothetical protein